MPRKTPRRTFLALAGGALIAPKFSFASFNFPTMLDHILLGCSGLDRGIDFLEQRTGVKVAFGVAHPGRGTCNALLSLGEMHYLEIIAPDPQQLEASDVYGVKKLTEPRLVSWAAHPGDITQFAAGLRNRGIAFEGPIPGSRKRPNGRLLQWQTLRLKDDHSKMLPFFIEWNARTVHPSADAPGGCKIDRFTISSPNDTELQRLCSALGLDVRVEHAEKPQLSARISGPNGVVMQVSS